MYLFVYDVRDELKMYCILMESWDKDSAR